MKTGTLANKEWAQRIGKGTFKRTQVADDAEPSPSQLVPVSTLQIIINCKELNSVQQPSAEKQHPPKTLRHPTFWGSTLPTAVGS